MGRRTDKEADDWFGVLDSRKRKQIQDRLAQRARRQRLGKNSGESSCSMVKRSTQSSNVSSSRSLAVRKSPCTQPIPRLLCSEYKLSPDPCLTVQNHTVYSALFQNGVILGLACGSSNISRSRLPLPHVPESLHPTATQLAEIHFEWIDRFPMPVLRDNLITRGGLYSYEDFLADLFMATTFVILPGRMSWDPEAWKADEGFKRKWHVLFD